MKTFITLTTSLLASSIALANTKIPTNFDVYTIKNSGTYEINGTVTGKYIDIKDSADEVTIIGVGSNPTFKGKAYNEKRSNSHIRGGAKKTTIIKDFTFVGRVKHNFMSLSGNSNKTISNLIVINDTKEGAGAINPGSNSMVKNCVINPHDDAIKITEENSRAKNNTITMDGNGAVIQLGWGLRANGAVHYAENTTIRGYLKNNKQTNTDNNPGRAIIGGIFENDVNDVKITGLDIDMSSQHTGHYIKLKANGGKLKNVTIEGTIKNNISVASSIKPVALSTAQGGKIENIAIDFKGNIQANHVHKDGGVSGFQIK